MAIYLNEEEVQSLLKMDESIEAVEEALREKALGKAINRPRYRLKTTKGVLHLMSAAIPSMGVMGYKAYITSKGSSVAPTLKLMLYKFDSGELLAVIEAFHLTQFRTGAASAVATRHMARKNSTSLGVIGAGFQGEAQVEAISRVAGLRVVKIYDIDSARNRRLKERIGSIAGLVEVISTAQAREAVRDVDIIVTSTNSSEPVLLGDWLRDGVHINAMGSNSLGRREIDDAVVSRSSIIVVDDREESMLECGDLLRSVETGALQWEHIPELGEVVVGKVSGRMSNQDITLFESHGLSLEDVAVGACVYRSALGRSIGQPLPF